MGKIFKNEFSSIDIMEIDDISKIEHEIGPIAKLSRNENIYGPSEQVYDRAKKISKRDLYLYPELEYTELDDDISNQNHVENRNIFVASGSDEFIYYFASATISTNKKFTLFENTFRSYEKAFKQQNGIHDIVKWNPEKKSHDIWNHDFKDSKIVVMVIPNMPTGEMYTVEDVKYVHSQMHEDALLIIDMAYIEYTDVDPTKFAQFAINNKNVIIERTFSKFYGLAGLRIGYILASSSLIKLIKDNIRRLSTSRLSFELAHVAILDKAYYKKIYDMNTINKKEFLAFLDSNNIKRYPANGNFVLIETSFGNELFNNLLYQRNILIRKFKDPSLLRITIGTKKQMQIIMDEIKKLLK